MEGKKIKDKNMVKNGPKCRKIIYWFSVCTRVVAHNVILVIVGYRMLAQGSCWSWNLVWLFEVRVLLKRRLSS